MKRVAARIAALSGEGALPYSFNVEPASPHDARGDETSFPVTASPTNG
jgi:hypothetical protein